MLLATKAGLIHVRSNLITQIISVFSTKFAEKSGLTLSPEERKAFRCRNFNNRPNPCIWYNWQVVDEYLEKDSYKIIVAQHLPPKEERDEFAKIYFPKEDDKRVERGPVIGAQLRRTQNLWVEWWQEQNQERGPVEEDFVCFFRDPSHEAC